MFCESTDFSDIIEIDIMDCEMTDTNPVTDKQKIVWHTVDDNPHPKVSLLPNCLVLCTDNINGKYGDGDASNVYLGLLQLIKTPLSHQHARGKYEVIAVFPDNTHKPVRKITHWAMASPLMKLMYIDNPDISSLKLHKTPSGGYYSYTY